jgi:two-component system response regulator AtoC
MTDSHLNKILIVEEESLLGWSMVNVLARAGYEPDVVECGDEALMKMSTGGYDLAIIDYRLPGMDGLELAARIKKISTALPVIMITTQEDLNDVELSSAPAVDCIVEKPLKLTEIVMLVGSILESSEKHHH